MITIPKPLHNFLKEKIPKLDVNWSEESKTLLTEVYNYGRFEGKKEAKGEKENETIMDKKDMGETKSFLL